MRILHLNTYHTFGGAAIAAGRLHRALRKIGIDSSMLVSETTHSEEYVTSLTQSAWQRRLNLARFALDRLSFIPYERNRNVRFAFSPAQIGNNLYRHPLILQADILHLHWTQFGYLSIAGLQKLAALRKPIVWTMHDMWAFTGGCHHSGSCERYRYQCGNCESFLANPTPDDLSHRVWLRKQQAYSTAQLNPIACSEWLAGRARQSELFRNLIVNTIPNPLDTNQFSPIENAVARRFLNLPTDKWLILFAATKVTAIGKGFSYFQQALHQLTQHMDQFADVELLIFGAGDEQVFQTLPFRYHFLGNLNNTQQIRAAYSAADLFVIPSLEENLPNTIMESMACGTPVVGFDVGGIPEMIRHCENGYLARYRSVEDLAAGIRWIQSQSPVEYQRLATAARQHVLDRYEESLVASQYLSVYQQLLQVT